MATRAEVEATLGALLARFERVDATMKLLLPSQRTIETVCPDLDLTYHAYYRNGVIDGPHEGSAPSADIRFVCDSDDLIAISTGELSLARAYASDRVEIEASMTDLLLLRSVL